MKLFLTALLTAALAFAQGGAGKGKGKGAPTAPEGPPIPCDRACLIGMVDTYLAALVAHDPSKAPMFANVRFVENAVKTKVGEGLWKTASAAPTTFKIYVPDAVSGQVAFMGVMQESGKPVQLGLRLEVVNKQITAAEHLLARNLSANQLANLQTPRPALLAAVPPAERSPRDYMLNAGNAYYDALVAGRGDLAPFADDCVRRENGMQTNLNPPPATPGPASISAMRCAQQLDTKRFSYIKVIDNRRVQIADLETGLVVGFSHFRHPMKEKVLKIVGVPGVTTQDMSSTNPFDLPAMHIFKIRGGKIHEIEAMGFSLPYKSPTGWEP